MIDDGPCTNVRVVKDVSVAEDDVGFDGASLANDGGLDVGVVGDAGVRADEGVGTDFACAKVRRGKVSSNIREEIADLRTEKGRQSYLSQYIYFHVGVHTSDHRDDCHLGQEGKSTLQEYPCCHRGE